MVEDESFFFPFLKKMSAISLPLRLQQTSSSFSLCLRYFLERIWRGRRENCTVGSKKKKERNISFNSSGDGEKWQLQGGQGDHEKCFVGDEREKKWIFAEKNFDPTTDEKKMFQKFVSLKDFLFFPICLFSSLLFSFPKKTKILFLLFKFPLR